MTRHYFLSSSLWELELVERQLSRSGFSPAQVHVHSRHPGLVKRFHLIPLSSLIIYDLLYYAWRGLQLGAGLAMAILGVFFWLGVGDLGWVPIWMFAALVLGFCTWEGGLIGINSPHHNLERFDAALKGGNHVLLVDSEAQQTDKLLDVIARHPMVIQQGKTEGVSAQLVALQNFWMNWRNKRRTWRQ